MNHYLPQLNPQDNSIVPHSLYKHHKQSRLQIQNQRQQAQHTIAYLERQAKKTIKEAERKKQSLQNYYKIVKNKVEDYKNKQQHHQRTINQLERIRQTNLTLKIESATKRTNARNKLKSFNQQIASEVKSFRSLSEQKIYQERELQRSLLKKKNESLTSRIMEANANSRVRAMGVRRAASSEVKGQLIHVQLRIKQRQIDQIAELNLRQKQLLKLVEKGRKEKEKYDTTLWQAKTLPIDQVYSQIKATTSSKRNQRRSHLIS